MPSPTNSAPQKSGLLVLGPDAIRLLRTVGTASPSARRLALGTAPLRLRTALIMAQLCTDERDVGGPACELTPDGLAVLGRLAPLSPSERQELSREVDERLAKLHSGHDELWHNQPQDDPSPTMSRPSDFTPDWCVAPGETLREYCVEKELSSRAAATACGIEQDVFEGLLSGGEPITDALAAGLARGTGITASFWLNFERHYREALASGKVVTK